MWSLLLWLACSSTEPAAAPPAAGPPPAPVTTAPVRRGDLSDSWSLMGEVRALDQAELAAGADGPLRAVYVREGDRVAEGQLLAEVEPALPRAELASAKASAARAKANAEQAARTLQRVDGVAGGVLAADEVDQARARGAVAAAEQAMADAAVQLAAARLDRHRVVAPFAGAITRRHADPGDWVTPGAPVLDLVRVEPVEVEVDVPASLAGAVREGDTVRVAGAEGRVVGVAPALDASTRTARVRVRPDAALLPGSTVTVAFDVARSGGWLAPRDALVANPDRVFRVRDGRAEAVPVTVVAATGDEVLLDGDLALGDALVVRGNERLRPDQPVVVQP